MTTISRSSRRPRRLLRWISLGLIVLLAVLLIGPFLVPVPPLTNTVPPTQLADADSQFLVLNGLSVHVKTRGQGAPALVLLHGFGASLYSWQPVLAPLSDLGTVIAYDRPAFGLTERPLTWDGPNPYGPDSQIALLITLLDHYGLDRAILVGNSAGGTVAMQAALAHPDRVAALILVDPAVYSGGGAPAWLRPLLATPQMRHLGPLVARQLQSSGPQILQQAWHDPARLPAETVALYQKPLQAENWDTALWELTLASRPSGLPDRLAEFNLPILVITVDDDRIVPTDQSVRLASELPGAQLVVIPAAGHVPHEEQPEAFVQAVAQFVQSLPVGP